MKKIGFVTPWFGMDITGGAEAELRELVLHLRGTGLEYEVLTTCVKSFTSDWSTNYHKPGVAEENGVTVRRFKADKRDTAAFDAVNSKLMKGVPVSPDEQQIFIEEMVNSRDLYRYMEEKNDEYALFVFIPYMFGTTYYGVKINPSKAVLIPCFHDESYFHMDIFRELYSQAAGMIYNAEPERQLTERCYDMSRVRQIVMGIGMDTELQTDPERFREKYHITEPFILYAGRKDAGKNVDTLIRYFCEFRKREQTDMKLVLIGGGSIDIPGDYKQEIIDLGFVEKQDKYDACAAAEFLCQPSHNESFSLVIMESWLCGRPVLVHEECAVTKNFVKESNGGLYFRNYWDFEGSVKYLLTHREIAAQMGLNGRSYVMSHFAWDTIIKKYLEFFEEIISGEQNENRI